MENWDNNTKCGHYYSPKPGDRKVGLSAADRLAGLEYQYEQGPTRPQSLTSKLLAQYVNAIIHLQGIPPLLFLDFQLPSRTLASRSIGSTPRLDDQYMTISGDPYLSNRILSRILKVEFASNQSVDHSQGPQGVKG